MKASKSLAAKALASAALFSLLATPALANEEHATPAGKEKCYGIAKTGKNDCKASDGSHACKGHAAADHNPHDFMLVDHGTCKEHGGEVHE